jgi:hypothetical protein
MTGTLKFVGANNAASTIAASIGPTNTVIVLATGTGGEFPTLGAGQQFAGTLTAAGNTTGVPNEIVYVTAITGDTLTVVRGQEGSSPSSWVAGANFANLFTEGVQASLAQQVDVQQQIGNSAHDTGTANAVVITLNPVPVSLASLYGSPIRIEKSSSSNTGPATLAVNGYAATPILYQGLPLVAGDLGSNTFFDVSHDGSNFELLSPPGTARAAPPSGVAGGDLTGSYPNPTLGAGVVDNDELAADAVATTNIQPNAVTNALLAQAPAGTVKSNLTGSTANESDNTLTVVAAALAPYIDPNSQFRNQQVSGASSGETLSAGGYTVRSLNVQTFNSIPGATFPGSTSHNVFLPAGNYFLSATAIAQASSSVTVVTHKLRFHDDDDNTVLMIGQNNAYAGGANNAIVQASMQGAFTVPSGGRNCSLQSWVNTACTGGPALTTGDAEVYVDIVITQITA